MMVNFGTGTAKGFFVLILFRTGIHTCIGLTNRGAISIRTKHMTEISLTIEIAINTHANTGFTAHITGIKTRRFCGIF